MSALDFLSEGLFTKREGYPCASVLTLASGFKLCLVYKQISQVSPGSTLPALLTCFVMRDILCNGPRFEIILKFSMENTLNSRKKGKYYHRIQKITFYFSDAYN